MTVPLPRRRHRISVHGVVQGVGFRPFVYALAREFGLAGQVGNTGDGVLIEVEGTPGALAEFAARLASSVPALAVVTGVEVTEIDTRGGTDFVIGESSGSRGRTLVSPDVATCDACSTELADPADRRYRHPFISCTNCGPRFTVIVDLPYDRPATTMADLPLCAACAAEYADPGDRRFHAQTVACPDCGPSLTLWRPAEAECFGANALDEARRLLASGAVVAVKGLGGYHLACDAADETAVATLRKRKDRGDKPFAVMVADLGVARTLAEISPAEAALLTDPRRPVVLLTACQDAPLAASVAPDCREVGVMLAYTPVHQLLFGLAGDRAGPVVLVMTSGNGAGDPIVTDDAAARVRLGALADAWLAHDRPIHVPCDDSVVRVLAGSWRPTRRLGDAGGQILPVRRSRGYAPLPVALPVRVRPVLAVGGDLKNTFALADGGYAWMSAHVGDMDDLATVTAFGAATAQLAAVTGVRPELVVADRHPAYRSTAWADHNPAGLPVAKVQHHHAHIASCMAENGHDGGERVIGFAFDGTGFGEDGALGGEMLLADYDGFTRAAHLGYVALPGGDAGVRNPCRMALSHLHSAGVPWDPRLPAVAACSRAERTVLARQLETGLRVAPTSSMGRLFDAVSSLAGVCHRVAYEAEAAMRFEALARETLTSQAEIQTDVSYEFGLPEEGQLSLDARPVVAAVAAGDVLAGVPAGVVAARFHLAVAALVAESAAQVRERTGLHTVALSGGVFLNALLTVLCVDRLERDGFHVLRHRLVPPSDAGLALGQLVIAARIKATK